MCNFPTIKDAADVVVASMLSDVQVSRVELLIEVQVRAVNIANGKNLPEFPTLMFEFIGNDVKFTLSIKFLDLQVEIYIENDKYTLGSLWVDVSCSGINNCDCAIIPFEVAQRPLPPRSWFNRFEDEEKLLHLHKFPSNID
ncbi:hypothetical protein ACOSP7_029593 [Xanthoceras sorbifolium]